jgi:hypothetical protein
MPFEQRMQNRLDLLDCFADAASSIPLWITVSQFQSFATSGGCAGWHLC